MSRKDDFIKGVNIFYKSENFLSMYVMLCFLSCFILTEKTKDNCEYSGFYLNLYL